MEQQTNRKRVRRRIRYRIRRHVEGTAVRPRLAVYRSLKHIYAQAIDDAGGKTVACASSLDPALRGAGRGGDSGVAAKVGTAIADRLKQAGIEMVVFDRGGFLYHGRVKALADAARAAGLKF